MAPEDSEKVRRGESRNYWLGPRKRASSDGPIVAEKLTYQVFGVRACAGRRSERT
jgi:hypothetical protein